MLGIRSNDSCNKELSISRRLSCHLPSGAKPLDGNLVQSS